MLKVTSNVNIICYLHMLSLYYKNHLSHYWNKRTSRNKDSAKNILFVYSGNGKLSK
jgi:hypothetical protein